MARIPDAMVYLNFLDLGTEGATGEKRKATLLPPPNPQPLACQKSRKAQAALDISEHVNKAELPFLSLITKNVK